MKKQVFTYDVVYNEGAEIQRVYMCYSTRTAAEVAEWFVNHYGAENPRVTICDNPNAGGAMVVRI